jgi:hypothetical protein
MTGLTRDAAPYAESAPAYREAGYSPIPERPGTKRPAILAWSAYCDRPPTREETEQWAAQYPGAGIALALGRSLNAIDIDTDDAEILEAVRKVLPEGAPAKRGRKGLTYFFRGDVATTAFLGKGEAPGKRGKPIVEILGHGKKTTIPPSIHPDTGKPYEWLGGKSLLDVRFDQLPELPADIAERLEVALKPWLADKPSWDEEERSFEVRHQGDLHDAERARYKAYAQKALEGRAADLANMGEGGRNGALFTASCRLGKWEHYGILAPGTIARELSAACERNGLVKKDGRPSILATIKGGIRRSQNDPLPLLPDRAYPGTAEEQTSTQANGSWKKPEPLVSKIEPEPYPIDALPDGIRAAVEEVHDYVMAPLAMVATSALTAISVAAQAHIDVRRDEVLVGPVSLFTVALGESGERKSQVDKMFTEAIEHYEDEQAELGKPLLAHYRAELTAWESLYQGVKEGIRKDAKDGVLLSLTQQEARLHDLESKKPKKPRIPKLRREDVTPEGLAKRLQNDWPSAGIMSNEAGIVFGAHGMNNDTVMRNLSLLNKLWDGGRYQSDRSDDERCRDVRGARLTMGLMVQEAVLREFFERSKGLARGSGFLARFLIAWPTSTMGSRFYKSPKTGSPALQAYSERLSQILASTPSPDEDGALSPTAMMFSPEAKAAWVEHHDEVEAMLHQDGELHDIKDVASKSADNAARLAALFAFYARGAGAVIEKDEFLRGARIASWHLREARRFLGELCLPKELAHAVRLDRYLIEQCRKNGNGIVLRSKVQNSGPYALRDGKVLDAAVKELEGLGRAKDVKNGSRREIQLNPELLNGGAQ